MSDLTTQAASTPQSQPQPTAGRNYHLRLWPGVVLVAAFWLVQLWSMTGEPAMNKFFIGKLIAPQVVLAGLLLWWLTASRVRFSDRLLVVGTLVAVTVATMFLADESFRGMGLIVYAAPLVASVWLGWLLISSFLSWPVRRAVLLLIFIAVGAGCCLLRIDGVNGDFVAKFNWRWTPTPEQKLLAELKSKPAKAAAASSAAEIREQPGDWPGFRGAHRDGRLTGVRINTDWKQSPPKELWRHAIGPGWSSFTAVGDRLFTQEQRGPDEYVVCYDAATGDEVWAHHDTTRFSDGQAGAGPRATPTFHDGRLYTYGANSQLNCLDAASGKQIWSHDVAAEFKAADAKEDIPMWGFASSPLVTHGLVVVFAGARDGKTLVAYNEEKGDLAWTASVGPKPEKPDQVALSYCSPELATVDGDEQILLATDAGVSGFKPADGKELWHHSWMLQKMARIVQPAVVGDGDVLIGSGMGNGTRRIHVSRKGDEWHADDQQWTSLKFKPYYNDFVVLGDYLYGFESGKLLCVSLKDGSEAWHAKGYGNGQVLLLADQALLLVQCEEPGEVALVAARPEKCDELCRFKAIEGKTWNHPVIAHGKLYVRNGEEMACFKLALEEETGPAKKLAAAAR